MIQIKFIKDTELCKAGEIYEVTKKNAESYVSNGYAEWIGKCEMIPEKIRGFNFVLIGGDGKKPIEKAWQKKIHRIDDPMFQRHNQSGKNYGVQSNNSSVVINGETYFLVIIDFDKREIQDKIIDRFPETFTTTSGSSKNCVHLWFASDNNKAFKIKDEGLNTLVDVIGAGNQVIAPGSKHSSGSIYSVVKDIPIVFMAYAEIEAILRPHDRSPKKQEKPKKQFTPKNLSSDISSEILNGISMEEVLQEGGVDTSKNPTNCPFHSSAGGKCLGFDDVKAHCFHCDNKWNKFSFIRELKNLTDKETFNWFAEKTGRMEELKKSRKEYVKTNATNSGDYTGFSLRGQIENFWTKQPFFYDDSKMFWIWDKENFRWIISDEVNFCNSLYENIGVDTIGNKERYDFIDGFRQIGRLHKPKPFKKNWVQLKDKVYDVKSSEVFNATPEYFIKNPIAWKKGDSEETPTIDKLFGEWVEPPYVETLNQITAYTISPNRFMQRIIALVGGGNNGKGSYIKFLQKFLGEGNYVSSELKQIAENQFETATIYGKLLVVFGEVSYDDLRNTNTLKQIAGEDLLRYCFKGKTPFTDYNSAMGICLTNSLPITRDKTTGFYRKWLIIDFPNQFRQLKEDLISKIPDVEFENLANKSLRILKELYENPSFQNEGDFDERMRRYEERSNPVMRFIEEYCIEEAGNVLSLREFTDACNNYLKGKHLRILTAIQIGKILRNEGFIVGSRKVGDMSFTAILNLALDFTTTTTQTTQIPSQSIRIEMTGKRTGSNGSNGNLDQFSDSELKEAGWTREKLQKELK